MDDKEIDEFYIKGMILAARAILLFGNDRTEIEKTHDDGSMEDLIIETINLIYNYTKGE